MISRFYWCCTLISYLLLTFAAKHVGSENIVKENQRLGSNQWWYKQNNDTPIAKGYTTKFSYVHNDFVMFKISSLPNLSRFTLGIFRLGYYSGMGGRLIDNLTVIAIKQPSCLFEWSSRMTDCSNWLTSAQWRIPAGSLSGVYIALPMIYDTTRNVQIYGTYIPFVVRQSPNSIGSKLLFKTSDLTWVAYNMFGNWNLYRGNGSFSPDSRAYKASYNRPWQNRLHPPDGHPSNFLFGSEFAMLFWLEKQGYDVSYCSCQDIEDMHRDSILVPPTDSTGTDSRPAPPPFKVLLSVGHDEYWTQDMKNAFEHAREKGVHLAFFSGNEIFWRVLWEENSNMARNQNSALVNSPDREEKWQNSGAGEHVGRRSRRYLTQHSLSNNTQLTETAEPTLLDHITQRVIALDRRRIVVCRKDTISNTAPTSAEDWTGTFRDPRHRAPEDESLLSGQWFMVNAHRRDAMEVTREDATLRFWRDTSFYNATATTHVHGRKKGSNGTQSCAQQRLQRRKSHQNDDIAYVTAAGMLGYEWDIFPTHARPPGLFPLSTTRIHVVAHLAQDFGASYMGNGYAVHRLSMHRHYSRRYIRNAPSDPPTLQKACDATTQANYNTSTTEQTVDYSKKGTSLVFGAGTIQWSWALSDWHDGHRMHEDRDLQQATLNVLADMGVFPATLRSWRSLSDPAVTAAATSSININAGANVNITCSHSTAPLVYPAGSTDNTPPTSAITSADLRSVRTHHKPAVATTLKYFSGQISEERQEHQKSYSTTNRSNPVHKVLKLRGTADDTGGKVAAVEVSINAGRTWHLASGRNHWYYTHHFVDPPENPDKYYKAKQVNEALDTFREELYQNDVLYNSGILRINTTIIVMTRAVDDSGWMEQLDVLSALCQISRFNSALEKEMDEKQVQQEAAGEIWQMRSKRILSPNAIVIKY